MTGALHFSRLKLMAMSPAHFRAGSKRATREMGLGTLIHALILGGDAIVYDGERKGAGWAAFKALVGGAVPYVFDGPHQGKAWREARDEARSLGSVIVSSADVERARDAARRQADRAAAGRYELPIVTSAEYTRARECAAAVVRDPLASELLMGEREVPLTWRFLGRDCAGQIDVLHRSRITDLKTTACAEPSWFQRQVFKMGYHAQLPWYREGALAHGYPAEGLFLVAVEPKPPYAVTCFRLSQNAIDEGLRLIRMWMERLAVCEQSDTWPAYCQSIIDIDTAPDVDLIFPEDETEEEAA